MADFLPLDGAIVRKTYTGTPDVGVRGLETTELTQTKNSEVILLEEVISKLFPAYMNTDAKMTMEKPQSAGADAAYNPTTREILLGNIRFGGDSQWSGSNKKYSRSDFSQGKFDYNVLTALHELGHAQRAMPNAVDSMDDFSKEGVRRWNKDNKMSEDNYQKMQKILEFAAQEGFPSMRANAFGNRSLEEFLVEVYAMKDFRDAGFNLPKKEAARLEKVEQVQAGVPWFDNYIKSQNRPDAPTLKEGRAPTKIPSPKDLANAARDKLTNLIFGER